MTGHPIVHIEIPALQASAAGKFYNEVFGWQIETSEEFNYVQFKPDDGPGGGFVELAESNPPVYKPDRLLVYLNTDDIDVTLAVIEAHGGKTVKPKEEIPGVGWWAVFTDPSGNHLALFTPAPRA